MGKPSFAELQVTLKLQKGDDAVQTRTLSFNPDGGSIQIGRASKTERKQLVAGIDNLWIANPVISREHAFLSVEKDDVVASAVFLQDDKSSHGTFINNRDIRKNGKTRVFHGDSIQFGDHVMRGTDSFDPPLFRVEIRSLRNPVPAPPHPTTSGSSWKVPDDSDDSEMDESDSDVQSTRSNASQSSPPHSPKNEPQVDGAVPGSGKTNFLKVDDNMPLLQDPIIVEEVLSSREVSVGDEPKANEVIADTYFGNGKGASGNDSDMSEDYISGTGEAGIYFTQRQESPVYAPQSPVHHITIAPTDVISPSHAHNYVPQQFLGDMHHYAQGPFAQPQSSDIANVYEIPLEAQRELFEAEEASYDFEAQFSTALETPVPIHQSSLQATTIITTRDILNQERDRANKKNMSITSLIHPPTAAGVKRRADDMIEDKDEVGVELEMTASVVQVEDQKNVKFLEAGGDEAGKTAAVRENEGAIEISKVDLMQTRPTKRLRTIASHVGSFALGGIAVLAGLASLPDNYFG